MSDANNLNIPSDLADMLPVGMLVNGGLAAEAMSMLANRKRGIPGWEAFHYERISDTQFDITGGIAVVVGGVKKWPGSHESVILSEAEIIEEIHHSQTGNAPPSIKETPTMLDAPFISSPRNTAATKYLNVVFALPEDEAGRQRILKAFHLQADFFGAKMQACSLID